MVLNNSKSLSLSLPKMSLCVLHLLQRTLPSHNNFLEITLMMSSFKVNIKFVLLRQASKLWSKFINHNFNIGIALKPLFILVDFFSKSNLFMRALKPLFLKFTIYYILILFKLSIKYWLIYTRLITPHYSYYKPYP